MLSPSNGAALVGRLLEDIDPNLARDRLQVEGELELAIAGQIRELAVLVVLPVGEVDPLAVPVEADAVMDGAPQV